MAWTSLTYPFASVLTSAKMTQNQANFTALANGDSGAPPVTSKSIATSGITAGSVEACVSNRYGATALTSYVEQGGIILCSKAGVIDIAVDLKINNAAGTVTGQLYKNGVATGTTVTHTGDTTVTEKVFSGVTVAVGDYFYVGIKSSGTHTASIHRTAARVAYTYSDFSIIPES